MENLNESSRRPRDKRAARPAGLSKPAWDALRTLFGVVLLVGVALLIWRLYWWTTHGTWNALRGQMSEYVELKNADPMGKVSPVKKLVVVDVRAKDLDGLHYYLPSHLQATRPDEVTTIAQVRRTSEAVGRYSGGGIAAEWTFEVTVIDRATKRTLETRSFKGGEAPGSVRRGSSGMGDKPIRDASDYLAGLAGRTF